MIGERVGDWVIDTDLGKDTHGRTYRAYAADNPTRLATIRILPNTPEIHELFRGRLSVLRKLSHPNLITYLGSGIVHGDPYFVADAPPGPSYGELLRDGKRPNWPEVLAIGMQCVSALRHAHRRGVLHGDLRPGNVYRAKEGQIKLAECGVARLFGADVAPPGENSLASAAFISPEQAAGKTPTKRGDFYSLGCLLYTLVAGRPPFTAASLVELIHKHCFVMPERPAHYQPDLPDEFEALIMKLLAKDPQVRPGSSTLLLAEFERVWASLEARGKIGKRPSLPPDDPASVPIEEEPPEEVESIVVPEKPSRPIMSRPFVVIPLFLLVVAGIVAGFYLSRSDPDDLWAQAQPLMRSDDPADWDRAWNDYLEPISRQHPNRYAEEIKAFRARTEPAAELRRSLAAGKLAKPTSEAERIYQRGVKLCQAGDFAGARREWERVVTAFAGVESESRWVELARQAATRMPQQEGALQRPTAAESIRAAISRAKSLRTEGKTAEADAVLDALESLYRDDPDAAQIQKLIAKERAP